jgi:threonine dehydrogenase-like Zn-dependent dehydrogenase
VGQKAVSGLVFDDELNADGISSGWGGFCEYVLVNDHERMVENSVDNEENGWVEVFEIQTPVINSIEYEDGVLLCTWREVLGAFRDFHLKKGDNVLIFGGGPVGLSFVKLGRLFGLGWIGLVDRHSEKKELAIQFGADQTFDRDDDGLKALSEKSDLHKLDAVIDAVGKPEIIEQSLPLIKRGGSICVYGFYAGLKEFVVHNSLADFNYNIFVHQWPTRLYEKESQSILCEWIEDGKLSGEEFISHRFNINEVSKALETVKERKVIKSILNYG